MLQFFKIFKQGFKVKAKDKEGLAIRILLIIQALLNGKDIDKLTFKDFDFNISNRTFQRDSKKIKDFFTNYQLDNMGGGGLPKTYKNSLHLVA